MLESIKSTQEIPKLLNYEELRNELSVYFGGVHNATELVSMPHRVIFDSFVEYFDIFVIHREKDEQKILKLKDILRKFVTFQDGRRLTFSLEDIGIPHVADKFDYFEMSLQHSRYKFIYIPADDDFYLESCDTDEDGLPYKMKKHYALNEMIRKKDSSVVPVTDSKSTKLPRLLDIFRRLDVCKLLNGQSLDNVPDVGELSDGDVDGRIVSFIRHMFDPTALPTPRSLVLLTYSIRVACAFCYAVASAILLCFILLEQPKYIL